MCGRYFIDDETGRALERIIDEMNRYGGESGLKIYGEVFPGDTVPVLASSRSLKPALFPMTWGYPLDNGRTVINARSETAAEKPMFSDGIAHHRCAIPAGSYFEWERRGRQKTKYSVRSSVEGAMYLAGIYRVEAGRPMFVVLTREPAANIAFIHDRMPVILPREAVSGWIDPRRGPEDLLRQAVLSVSFSAADTDEPAQMVMEL